MHVPRNSKLRYSPQALGIDLLALFLHDRWGLKCFASENWQNLPLSPTLLKATHTSLLSPSWVAFSRLQTDHNRFEQAAALSEFRFDASKRDGVSCKKDHAIGWRAFRLCARRNYQRRNRRPGAMMDDTTDNVVHRRQIPGPWRSAECATDIPRAHRKTNSFRGWPSNATSSCGNWPMTTREAIKTRRYFRYKKIDHLQ